MKKSSILFASALMAFCGSAYADEAPNRILVTDDTGNHKSYVIDYLQSLNFAYVDGDVCADVEVIESTVTSISVSIYKTDECEYFRMAILPTVVANQLTNPVHAISYVERSGLPDAFYEDFPNGLIQGLDLDYDTDYTVMTVGYDSYGTAVGVSRADFTTPAVQIKGTPHVDCQITERTLDSFTAKFTPNSDVSEYFLVAGEKGSMLQQFEEFGPMFGFANINQMIAAWSGPARTKEEVNTWKDMAPNEQYEIFVAMKDKNGNFAPYEVYETSTLSLGGHGDAYVTITPGDFKLMDWGDQMLPSQFFTFTPNENTSAYRLMVAYADKYDEDPASYKESICSEPPVPNMANWWQYYEITTDFQINENTSVVALAAGKNMDGKWGELNAYRYTTPSSVASAPAKVGAKTSVVPSEIKTRMPKEFSKARLEHGKVPVMNKPVLMNK